jgi:hypothetical protein
MLASRKVALSCSQNTKNPQSKYQTRTLNSKEQRTSQKIKSILQYHIKEQMRRHLCTHVLTNVILGV